jgi:hypothetical protein
MVNVGNGFRNMAEWCDQSNLLANEHKELQGILVAPSAPSVNHLLFVDDSLLFFRANRESAQEVKDVLQFYCRASGNK